MAYTVTKIDMTNRSRAGGELFNVRGFGFMALPSSFPPRGLSIALDESNAARLPVFPGLWIRHPFKRLYLFHSQSNTFTEPLTIITLDDPCARMVPAADFFRYANTTDGQSVTAAGNTVVVPPVLGTRIRLLRYRYQLRADATLAVAGEYAVALQSSSPVGVLQETEAVYFLPISSPAGAFGSLDTGWIDVPYGGILLPPTEPSLTLGALNLQANAALATGKLLVNVEFRREPVDYNQL